MHESVRAWVAVQVKESDLASTVTLEVGSRDENGSVRDLFSGPYTGVDMRAGPGVDVVMNGHGLDFGDASFGTVVCTEVIEHDPAFWRTLAEIGRVLEPGGHLLLTTRGNGFHEHAFPSDLWRFMPSSAELLAFLAGCKAREVVLDEQAPGLFIHGVRA